MSRRRDSWFRITLLAPLLLLAGVPLAAFARSALSLATDAALRESLLVALPRWGTLLTRSAAVVAIALGVALPLATLAAGVATRTRAPLRGAILPLAGLAACLPLWTSIVLAGGVIDYNRWFHSLWLCGLIYAAIWLPLAVLMLGVAWRGVDRSLEEAALLDASPTRVAWCVSLPALSGALAATAILIGVLVAADNSVSDLLAVRTFAEESYTQFLLQFDGRLAVLSAAPLMALLAAMLALARRPLKNWSEAAVTRAAAARPLWPAGGPGGALLSAAGVAIAAPLLMIGLWPLLAKTGGIAAYAGALHQTGPQLVNSMLLGATAACGLTLLAPGWAWLLGSGGRTARAAGVLIVVLLATPAAVVGVSLVELSNARFLPAGWRDSAAIVVLGYFVRFAPLAALLLTPGVRRVPIELESLARVDGCGAAGVLRHVVWPLCRRDAGVATLLLTMLCFGEVIATHLLAPPQWQTAGVRAFTLMHFGLYADLAALGLTGMLATAGLWLALWRLWSWRRAD